jgi:hypothetical protein
MATDVEGLVRDARPPAAVLRLTNPILKTLLRTPLARAIRPLALLEFRGRRSGRCIRVVVGWHIVEGEPVVVTPAPWRRNFADGAPATMRWRGRRQQYIGTLDDDPAVVANAIDGLLRAGTSARALALRVPGDHRMTSDDVVRTRRAVIRFRLPDSLGAGEG